MSKETETTECCANCRYCISFPKNNRYNDIEHLCVVNGYFTYGIYKDRHKIKHYTPGGRLLTCRYERKEEGA